MRVFTVATILLLSSSLVPSFGQDQVKSASPSQPQTVPVQPERSPQQSDQALAPSCARIADNRRNRGSSGVLSSID
jgi:hypothetical protein